MLAYAYNSAVAVAAPKAQPVTLKKVTKRSFAIDTLMNNAHLLEEQGHKIFRKTCLDAILANFPGTSQGSLGAIYNDAKHLLISNGLLAEFGRYGQGRNKHSKAKLPEKPKQYEVPEGHAWVLVNKETRKIEGSAESKSKCAKLKTSAQTVKKYAEMLDAA